MNKLNLITLVAFICLSVPKCPAQQDPGQVVQTANQKINSGAIDEAIILLNNFLEKNPNHTMALGTMGLAYRRKKEYDESLKFYKEALESRPESVSGQFNLGIAYALAENLDKSFEMLMQVKRSNAFNITNIGLSPAAGKLKTDVRYQQLFPTPEEYADAFIEEASILFDWQGEAPNDQFGWIARNIGDVDGDGVFDVTTSAPTNNEGAKSGGKIYVYSGKTGALIWSYAGTDPSGQLGMSIEAAGDVNGDKIPDVVAGAPYANRVMVFSGIDGKILQDWKGNNDSGALGIGVRGVGDVNRDGYGDVLASEPFQIWGAPYKSDKIAQAGSVYLYSGKDGTVLKKWSGEKVGDGFGTSIGGKTTNGLSILMMGAPNAGDKKTGRVYVYEGDSTDPKFIMEADSTGGSMGGMFMSVVGDINADGIQDVYASDFANGALGFSTGRAYINSGKDGSPLYVFTGEAAGDGFGIGVADAGDINQDGYDDLVIGAWQHASAAPSGGKVYVYSGKDGSTIRTLTGKVVGETLGFDATGIGDVNGDGVLDLLLTSAWSAINGVRSGRTLIVSGR